MTVLCTTNKTKRQTMIDNSRNEMTKDEFKARWESNDAYGDITYKDIADCAKAWGIVSRPRTMQIDRVCYLVLKSAGTNDAESFCD